MRDGEIYLEGAGVPPNVEVPATIDNLLDPDDEVIEAAEEALVPQIQEAAEAAATPASGATPSEATPVTEELPATPPVLATPTG
jgi:hypothetical protein